MTEKTTRKELFARIAETMADDTEVVEMCNKYIAQLSAKRKPKVKPELEEFRHHVLQVLVEQSDPVSSREMYEWWCSQVETITPQKMNAALRWLVQNGYAVAAPGAHEKCNYYEAAKPATE